MSMKNSNHTVGNRTRDLPPCGTVTHGKPNACFTCRKKDKSFRIVFLEWPHRKVVCLRHKKNFDKINASSFYRQVSALHLSHFLCVSLDTLTVHIYLSEAASLSQDIIQATEVRRLCHILKFTHLRYRRVTKFYSPTLWYKYSSPYNRPWRPRRGVVV